MVIRNKTDNCIKNIKKFFDNLKMIKFLKTKLRLLKEEAYWIIPMLAVLALVLSYLTGLRLSAGSIFSVILGALLAYCSSFYLKRKEIRENARTSALLIRVWLILILDEIINFKGQLNDRMEILSTINNFSDISQDNFLKVIQDFQKNKQLYELHFSLVKDIGFFSEIIPRYENVPRILSFALNDFNRVECLKSSFAEFKKHYFLEEKRSPDDFFISQLKNFFKNYLAITENVEKHLRNIFTNYQDSVCIFFKIRPLELAEGRFNRDDIDSI